MNEKSNQEVGVTNHGVIWHKMVLRTISYVKNSETSRVAYVEMQLNLYNITFIMYNADTYNHML